MSAELTPGHEGGANLNLRSEWTGEVLGWEARDGIGRISFNRPPANTMNLAFFDELHQLVKSVPVSSVSAVVIHGSGRHFSQGADLEELIGAIGKNFNSTSDGSPEQLPSFIRANNETFRLIRESPLPYIAAIRGVCLGSALELALACRLRICSNGATFALPESEFSLMPGCGGISALVGRISRSAVLELVLRGHQFSAEDALELGLVDVLTDRNSVLDTALEAAHKIVGIEKGAA